VVALLDPTEPRSLGPLRELAPGLVISRGGFRWSGGISQRRWAARRRAPGGFAPVEAEFGQQIEQGDHHDRFRARVRAAPRALQGAHRVASAAPLTRRRTVRSPRARSAEALRQRSPSPRAGGNKRSIPC
jgi:hypothetical protein